MTYLWAVLKTKTPHFITFFWGGGGLLSSVPPEKLGGEKGGHSYNFFLRQRYWLEMGSPEHGSKLICLVL